MVLKVKVILNKIAMQHLEEAKALEFWSKYQGGCRETEYLSLENFAYGVLLATKSKLGGLEKWICLDIKNK